MALINSKMVNTTAICDRVGNIYVCVQVCTPFTHVRTYSPKFALKYSFLGFKVADGKIKPFYKDDLPRYSQLASEATQTF